MHIGEYSLRNGQNIPWEQFTCEVYALPGA